ncbi:MAG: hypothetical protein FVQ84_17785 [Planctomycetes bacterium]|nr:hypothetical protein [Planctomycetota bacterium]
MNDLEMQELRELQVELNQIGEDFADLEDIFGKQAFGFAEDAGSSEALDALDVELENSGLIGVDSQSVGQKSLMALADGEIDEQSFSMQGWFPDLGLGGWLKKKAAKIIRKIVALVKRYKKYAKCTPAVTKAVALFKARKYGSALTQAYSAYRCIKNA